ncbi:hypothetical protein HPB50_022504 [Hyalomma asiaticum]|uniref:Uncharacterized protein n=1 Tax=Hyalomma asiaticum TaxID=266040 RepID=A0ACB7SDC1_HYAAI|nr:hypothetical protein HPB50_022504 [Hyalomma asiaticum]
MTERLQDETTYMKVNRDTTRETESVLQTLLTDVSKFVPAEKKHLYNQLLCNMGSAPAIYGLPKVHKPNVALLHRLSGYLHGVFPSLVGQTSTYVKDSADFVDKIGGATLGSEDVMVSFDVMSMFTRMPVGYAVDCCRASLENGTSMPSRTLFEADDFYQLAERVKLFVAYSESTDITCFAPTNDAIDRFRESFHNKPIEVTYHVVSLNLAEDNLPSSVPTIAKGSPHLYLTRARDRFFFVNNAKVTRRRELTFEQYKQKLYVIDDVLEAFIPSSGVTPNAFEFLNQPSIYNLNQRLVFFHSRVQMTYEQSLFTEDGMHTFFVPVDDADPAKRTRVEIDKYVVRGHVIKNRRLFTRTMGNETYESAAWEDNAVKVELSLANQSDSAGAEYTLFAQSNTMSTEPQRQKGVVLSKIVKPNIPVKNGVVHLIEKPLMVVDTSIKDFFHRERHGRLEDFMRLVDYSPDFLMDLDGNQPKTVFAPTNEALKVIPASVLDTLKANTSGLTQVH